MASDGFVPTKQPRDSVERLVFIESKAIELILHPPSRIAFFEEAIHQDDTTAVLITMGLHRSRPKPSLIPSIKSIPATPDPLISKTPYHFHVIFAMAIIVLGMVVFYVYRTLWVNMESLARSQTTNVQFLEDRFRQHGSSETEIQRQWQATKSEAVATKNQMNQSMESLKVHLDLMQRRVSEIEISIARLSSDARKDQNGCQEKLSALQKQVLQIQSANPGPGTPQTIPTMVFPRSSTDNTSQSSQR
jgi:hypothetical protein